MEMVPAGALALLVALAVDRLAGEPPARLHPVVWMGRYLERAGRYVAPTVATAPARIDRRSLLLGALAWCLGAVAVAAAAWALQSSLVQGPPWLAALLLGLLLKPLLAWRMLGSEVQAVEDALARSLAEGRARLALLVSRDSRSLTGTEVREAAIESLAENLNDSVVAPLFWFVVAGLPGAALYRFANTADAMWGYRGMRGGRCWEWAGKWAARADDLLSWLPARLTALALAAAAGGLPWRALRREAARTPSPNGGWPMAAMALALGLRLAKPGVYVLHDAGRAPQAGDTLLARRLAARALGLLILCALAALLVRAHA